MPIVQGDRARAKLSFLQNLWMISENVSKLSTISNYLARTVF